MAEKTNAVNHQITETLKLTFDFDVGQTKLFLN
jgi:hypothetical protein